MDAYLRPRAQEASNQFGFDDAFGASHETCTENRPVYSMHAARDFRLAFRHGIFFPRQCRCGDRYFEKGAFMSALRRSLFLDRPRASARYIIRRITYYTLAGNKERSTYSRPSVRSFKINSNLGSDRLQSAVEIYGKKWESTDDVEQMRSNCARRRTGFLAG